MCFVRFAVAWIVSELFHFYIIYYSVTRYRVAQHHTIETLTTGESYVSLTVCKGVLHIYYGTVKGESLALVHRDSPCGF